MSKFIQYEFLKIKKQFLFLTLLGIILSMVCFGINEKESKNYIQEQQKAAQISSYYSNIDFKSYFYSENKTKTINEMAEFMKTQSQNALLLKLYYEQFDTYKDDIIEQQMLIDSKWIDGFNKNMTFSNYELQNSINDVQDRIKLYNEYKSRNLIQPANPKTPTMCYVLYTNLNDFTVYTVGLLILLVIYTSSIWGNEFDNRTHYILFTLPYERKKIYRSRILVYCLTSCAFLIFSLCTLALLGLSFHGSGTNQLVSLPNDLLINLGIITDTELNTISNGILYNLGIFFNFLFLYLCITQLISLILKEDMNTKILMLIYIFIVIFAINDICGAWCPFFKVGVQEIRLNYLMWNCITLLLSIICLKVGEYFFTKRDS